MGGRSLAQLQLKLCAWGPRSRRRYREGTVRFFGKRGTSLMGFMLARKGADGYMDVTFYHMLTDDTCQDAHNVNAAKMLLFSELLSEQGIKRVFSNFDGEILPFCLDSACDLKRLESPKGI